MPKRSHDDWAALIKQQPASGLTITAFCRQHKLSTSVFYAHKASIANTSIPKVAAFVKATVATPTVMTTLAQPTTSGQTIGFQHQTGLWTFSCSLPASYLLEIIKGLQAC
jgi:hypothetical protein